MNDKEIKTNLSYYDAYFEAMFWADINRDTENYNDDLGYHSIDESSLIKVFKELDDFFSKANDILEKTSYTHEQACHDFYFTRCGHGVGFWEGDHCNKEQGEKLTEIAKTFGTVDIFIGDEIITF